MTSSFYILAAVAATLLAMHSVDAGDANGNFGLAPSSSFGEKKRERERRAIQQARPGMARPGGSDPDYMKLTITRCTEEGTVFIPGDDSYFLKCQRNKKTGGFFQIMYICPTGMRSPTDMSKCIPTDCDECEGQEPEMWK